MKIFFFLLLLHSIYSQSYNSQELPPSAEGGPTIIQVGTYYNSLIEINVAAGYSVIDFYASYIWNDTRLGVLYYNYPNFTILPSTIWNPSFEYLNIIEITKN